MTLRETLRDAIQLLEHHRVSSSRLSAEMLLANCLSVNRTYLYTHDERPISAEESRQFEEAISDRISGVPVQYIIGKQEFYGRYFMVSPAVLIPRPETEYVVETVIALHPNAGTSIIDVGTGSGCIGLTLALELLQTRVTIADISSAALAVARSNADSLGANAAIVCMDLLDAVAGPFDFIVSNPPYVSPRDASRLQREVREHEPHLALFAQDDGFAVFRRLIPSANRLLRPGGYFIAEIGFGMEDQLLGFFGSDWETLPTRPDLQGIPRTITARKRG